ncbi:DUF4064 domain-containing protein [bacterium]|nr:DUF4064 domain-containing protein [bacterium]
MLSKILFIIMSLLIIVLPMSAQSNAKNLTLTNFFVPGELDFSSPVVLIFAAIGILLALLGIIFSIMESSAKIKKLHHFASSGMTPEAFKQLDPTSAQIVVLFEKAFSQQVTPVQQTQQTAPIQQPIQKQEIIKQKENDLPDISSLGNFSNNSIQKEQPKNDPIIPKTNPVIPQNDPFAFNTNRTVEEEKVEAFGSPNLMGDDNDFAPSNFSDFAEDGDSSKGAATVIASIPEELLRQTQKNYKANIDTEEDTFKKVYQDYYNLKVECGESVTGLTEASFVLKLKGTKNDLVQKHNCKTVEFSVYKKDGKASLKATPKF